MTSETALHYVHDKNESIASRIFKIVMRVIRLKTLVERSMNKGSFNQDPAPIPKSLTDNFTIDESEVRGRQVWTLQPKSDVSDQVVVFLHGGAYIFNMASAHWPLVEQILLKTNATVIVADYPLAPQAQALQAFEFMETLYNQVLENTPADNIIFMGDSAGAGLAMGFAQHLRDSRKPVPQQLVLLAPWIDITMSNPDMAAVDKYDVVLNIKGLQLAGAAYAGDLDHTDYRVSPIYGDMAGLPKMSIFIGTHDLFIADCRKLKAKLEADTIAFNYFEYPKMIHDWVVVPNLPETKYAIDQITNLIPSKSTT